MRFLRTNTATIVTVGPFFDKTDGVTLETGLTITNERISLTVDLNEGSAPTLVLDNVTGATSGTANDLNYITNCDAGLMQIELAAANVNYVGRAFLTITDAANHCPVFHEFTILPANVYDALILGPGTDLLDVSAAQCAGTALTGRDIGASVLLSSGTGTGQLDFTSGVVKSNLAQILGTALTETGGLIAAAFKKFFNVATPTGTVNSLPDAVPGEAGGGFIAGTNAATTVTTALTTTFTGNLTGAVGSVTGAVGSVTGAVGSVAANGITATSIAADAINAASVKADAVTKIQNGLATPTNITAGTITTVTNLTNAPTNGDLTATMKTSVTTAATAATPTAAAVTGAVGSVAANGITATSIAADAINAAAFKADALAAINAEVDTALNTAIPGSPTADSINQRIAAIDDLTQASGGGDLAAIKGYVDDIGVAGAGLTAIPTIAAVTTVATVTALGAQAKLDVNAEVDTALSDIKLDHLVAVAESDDPVDNSILAKLVSKDATADWSDYNNTTDSLEANRDNLGTAGAGLTAIPTIAAVTTVGSVTGAVGSVTGAVGSVTGAVGSVTGAVGSVAANGITATSIAADAINAASVKADAVTKIQNGLATPTNITAGTITTVTNLTTCGDKTGYKLASDGLDTVAITAPSGVASNFREMLVQTWRRLFKLQTMTASELKTYADNGIDVLTTQTVTDDGITQTMGAAS